MSDKRDWQADKTSNLLKRCEIAKSYGETIAVSPDAIIELINQVATEKQRADIAELANQGLQEDVVTIGEYQSLLDKHTAMTKAYRGEKERADILECERDEAVSALTESYKELRWSYDRLKEQESELKETMKWAIEQSKWGDPENALDKIVNKLQNTLSTLYPKEANE